MPCTVVVGGFFGDEGKGKLIAYLAIHDRPKIVARGGVGPNAGHTVGYDGKVYSLRMIPSGFVFNKARLLIGPGVLLNPKILLSEIETTGTRSRIGVDRKCAVIEDRHIQKEMEIIHLTQKIGSTKSGVGTCNADRALRIVRLASDFTELSPFLTDVPSEIHDALRKQEKVLVEGTQGTFLSLYHGTYPYCTTKDVCASAICSDVGIGPTAVDDVIVVFKAFVTRVGEGPLENQLPREEMVRRGWLEFGTVTRRERRAAPFNYELAKKAVQLNGATQIAITKVDVVYPHARAVNNYDQLPKEVKDLIDNIQNRIGVPVTLIGTGPSAENVVDRRKEGLST